MRGAIVAFVLAVTSANGDLSLLQTRAKTYENGAIDEEYEGTIDGTGEDETADGEDEETLDEGRGKVKCKGYCFTNTKPWKKKCKKEKCFGCAECGGSITQAPTPSPTPNPTPNPTPSPTPLPTPNPTPNPTPSPTPLPTPNPTPNPTPSPTPFPTPFPTPAPTPPVVRHGSVVSIKNMYSHGGYSYLDTCGGGSCTGSTQWSVTTSSSSNRDAGTGKWTIERSSGAGIVMHGDVVYIKNMYGGQSYLDSCGGASCASSTKWSVYTNNGIRGSTSQWIFEKPSGSGAIAFGETVYIKNLYNHGGYTYLDSCGGASCAGSTKWSVHTSSSIRASTTTWQLIA